MSIALRTEDTWVPVEDYISAEELSSTKHEYLAGTVYAMAGASWEHNVIALNLQTDLKIQLRGKKCVPLGSDMRLRIRKPDGSFYYYPDALVDCSGSREREMESPTLVFEVLSPETARADRGEKLLNYQSIPSVRAYVLVDQFQPAVTVYRRASNGEWTREFLTALTETLALPEIGCALPLQSIYERVFGQV